MIGDLLAKLAAGKNLSPAEQKELLREMTNLELLARRSAVSPASTATSEPVGDVDWANVLNKPTVFPPEAHTHDLDEITEYIHDQQVASAVWTVTHNLGKYPSINVVDTSGDLIMGEVTYTNNNTLTITFSSAISGKAYLN